MPVTSEPIAMASHYATDDVARHARLMDVTRDHDVSIEEMDERTDDGLVQVRVFARDPEAMDRAIDAIRAEHADA
jgi:hypothetical protein